MERYLDDLRKESQLRKERLKRIRDLVMRGEYRVDPEKVAGKLIEDGLNNSVY
jgi:anti-sigma28 factor (negative regulator of flagellin synthesis)